MDPEGQYSQERAVYDLFEGGNRKEHRYAAVSSKHHLRLTLFDISEGKKELSMVLVKVGEVLNNFVGSKTD